MASDSGRFLDFLLLMTLTLLLLSSSHQATATEFHVGDKDGWVVKPSEDYNHWAQRNRFQVNDTLCEYNFSSNITNKKKLPFSLLYIKGNIYIYIIVY